MKFKTIALCLALAVSQLSTPQRANAVVSVASVNSVPLGVFAAMMIGGYGMLLPGLFGGGFYYIDCTGWMVLRSCSTRVGFELWVPLTLAGIVLLDSKNPSTSQLQPLSREWSERMELTSKERIAYNDELDEINALVESIAQEWQEGQDPRADGKLDARKVEQLWKSYRSSLSEDAASALEKVSRGMAKAAMESRAS